jgi:hypothetical protein
MDSVLIEMVKKVNKLNYLSNDYKLSKNEFQKILNKYKNEYKINITKDIEEFIIFVNGKMFFDWVVFEAISDIPVFDGKTGDLGLFYSLKNGTQYYTFEAMESNSDIIKKTDFIFAEATPGDYLVISFDEKDYGKIYFISHDFNENEQYKYLAANTLEELIKKMYIKKE